VLERENGIKYAENQMKEKAEQLAKAYNDAIRRGLRADIARDEYIKDMAKWHEHYMPLYRRAVPHLILTL
jgi:hypothetical protein